MKFTLNWLLDYLEPSGSLEDILEGLLNLGIEIEKVTNYSEILNKFFVAEILNTTKHLNADKLQICQVNIGEEVKEIVCGAFNARPGIKVIFAPLGSYIPGTEITLKETSIRGIKSTGMMLSEMEIGLSTNHEGIIEISPQIKVGTPAATALGLNDTLIETSITPNLGSLLSVRNIAKALAALGLGAFKDKTYPNLLSTIWFKNTSNNKEEWHKSSVTNEFKLNKTVENNSKNLTPTFTLNINQQLSQNFAIAQITNVNNNVQTPEYIKNRLKIIGVNLISPVVDITNYLTVDINHPMHAYHANTLGNNLTVTYGTKEDYITALNGKTYNSLHNIPVIKSNNNTVSIAGIIGSTQYSVTKESNNILLECAHFNPIEITKACKTLSLITDSSYHFQRNINYLDILYALNKALNIILESCGGNIEQIVLQQNYQFFNKVITTSAEYINNILGTYLNNEEIIKYFTNLGFNVSKEKNNLLVEIRSSRVDIEEECDLAELILKCYGIKNIKPQPLPDISNTKLPNSDFKLVLAIKKSLATLGLLENINMSFISKELAILFNNFIPELELLNPLSTELSVIRGTLIPSLVLNASNNYKDGYGDVSFFEVSNVYTSLNKSNLQVAGILSGYKNKKTWHNKNHTYNTFDSKETLFNLITSLGINPDKFKITRNELPNYYHPGKSGTLLIGNTVLGYFGELHPKLTDHFKFKNNPAIFELVVSNLPLPKIKLPFTINELSKQMPLERDFSFIFPKSTPALDVLKVVSNVNKHLITYVKIFDVFYIPNNNTKAIGITVTLTPKTTLTEKEINEISTQIIQAVTSKLNGSLRDKYY